jgi:hypothetical protein
VTAPGARPGDLFGRWRRRDDADLAPVLDLTDVDEVTTTLLAPPPEFHGVRRRVVDQFTLLSANRVLLARSVNWGPLDGLLTSVVPATGRLDTRGRLPPEVSLLLPLSTLPKRALVGFDLVGPGGSDAHLMPYATSVAVQGNVVALLAESIGEPVPTRVRRMVDAVSRFRPGRLSGNHPRLAPAGSRRLGIDALHVYLGHQADLWVPEPTLRGWAAVAEPAQQALGAALDEPFDPLSSAETLLLALGELWRDPDVPAALTVADIEEYLGAFVDWVARLAALGQPAEPVLSTVAEYGRRWEALAAVTLDPYRPSLIKMQEQRRAVLVRQVPTPTADGRPRRRLRPWRVPGRLTWLWAASPVALVDLDPGGPGSYHVSIGTDDSSIEINTPLVLDLWNRPVDRIYVEDVQRNREVYAYYSTDVRRPARALLAVGLSVSPDVSRVTGAILILMTLAVGLAALPFEMGADAVAVVVVPSSFAATLLLTRERSSLAAWVLGPAKLTLLALLMTLAVLSGLRALGWHRPADSPGTGPATGTASTGTASTATASARAPSPDAAGLPAPPR